MTRGYSAITFGFAIFLFVSQRASADELAKTAPFLEKHCFECHSGDTPEAGLKLDKLAKNLDERETFDLWVKIHDKVERGEMPPASNDQPTLVEKKTFLATLSMPLAKADLARQQKTGRTVLRRLNRVEYEHTLRDLLALPHLEVRDILPADPSSHGFDVVGEALPMSYIQQSAYLQAAEAALKQASVLRESSPRKLYQASFFQFSRFALGKGVPRPDDGLAIWVNHTLGPPTYLGFYTATDSGTYRLKIRARSSIYHDGKLLDAEKPQIIMLFAELGTSSRLAATLEAPIDRVADLEATVWLNAGEKFRLVVPTLLDTVAPFRTANRDLIYRGPAIAFESFEADGPVHSTWPPESHRRVLSDVPMIKAPPTKPPLPKSAPSPLLVHSKDPKADAERLVKQFVAQAFRRPAPQEELDRYVKLAQSRLEAGFPLHAAIQTAYKAVLCSPDVLYLQESPGKLDAFALANRLSYFLWRSMPDEPLLASARTGALSDPKKLRAQVDRMLSDPRSERFINDFTDQWLNLREINFTSPDADLYPEYRDLHLLDSLVRETRAYFADMIRNDLGARTVVDSDFAYLNSNLAELYGIEGVKGIEIRKVSLPSKSVRGGIITQASILKVTANGTTTSPVTRGAWLTERILGRPVPPPPANVPAVEPDIRGATTIREQLAKHRTLKECASCHAQIDPPGFALECFDIMGGFRERYRSLGKGTPVDLKYRGGKVKYRLGPPVDASGETTDGRKFADIREYKKLLIDEEEQLARNLVEKFVTFSTGAPVQFSDRGEIEAIIERLKEKKYGVRAMVYEVVQSRMFQNK